MPSLLRVPHSPGAPPSLGPAPQDVTLLDGKPEAPLAHPGHRVDQKAQHWKTPTLPRAALSTPASPARSSCTPHPAGWRASAPVLEYFQFIPK